MVKLNSDKEKNSGNPKISTKKIKIIEINKSFFIQVKGLHKRYKSKKLTKAFIRTHMVEVSTLLKEYKEEKTIIIKISRTMTIAFGKDFTKTLLKKFPRIRFLFGSSAKIKDGIPIATTLVNVNWMGSNG